MNSSPGVAPLLTLTSGWGALGGSCVSVAFLSVFEPTFPNQPGSPS